MSMYPHRGMGGAPPVNGSSRLDDLFQQIRTEFDNNFRQTESYDHQRRAPPFYFYFCRTAGSPLNPLGNEIADTTS